MPRHQFRATAPFQRTEVGERRALAFGVLFSLLVAIVEVGVSWRRSRGGGGGGEEREGKGEEGER